MQRRADFEAFPRCGLFFYRLIIISSGLFFFFLFFFRAKPFVYVCLGSLEPQRVASQSGFLFFYLIENPIFVLVPTTSALGWAQIGRGINSPEALKGFRESGFPLVAVSTCSPARCCRTRMCRPLIFDKPFLPPYPSLLLLLLLLSLPSVITVIVSRVGRRQRGAGAGVGGGGCGGGGGGGSQPVTGPRRLAQPMEFSGREIDSVDVVSPLSLSLSLFPLSPHSL